MGFSWRKTFKILKQTRKSKCLSAFDVEHAQCLTGYHVFMVSGLDLARAPRRRRLTARKKGSGYENVSGPLQFRGPDTQATFTRVFSFFTRQEQIPWVRGCPMDCRAFPNFNFFTAWSQNKESNQKGHSFDVRRSRRHRPAYTRERAAAMFLGSIV